MSMSFKYYFSIFLQRMTWFLVVFVAISGLAITVAMTLPPSYVSQVRLIVESAQIPGDLAESTVQISAEEQLQIFETRLLTRANMLDISRRLQVLEDSGSMSPDEIVDAMRARTDISTSAGRNQATLMTMSFEASEAVTAAAVLNEYLSLILREDAEYRSNRAGQTQEFFAQEVARLGDELSSQSAAILSFKNKNAEALPESLEYRREQQLSLQERIAQLQRDREALEDQRERLTQIYETTGRVDTATTLSPDAQRLRNLENELSEARAIYSENHPKLKSLLSRVAQARASLDTSGVGASPTDADPAKVMFDLQMGEIAARLEDLEVQRSQTEQRLTEVNATIEATPANSIALQALERDYDNAQAQYNLAVERLAKASTGERIETLARGQRITVVEQPTAPTEPSKPNRPMIAGGGLFVGLILGIALIVVLEMLDGTARRPADLVDRLGITPIGTIPYLQTQRQKMVRRSSYALIGILIITMIPTAIYLLHTYYLPLDLIAERVMNKFDLRG
ncbi:polysaccharide chain length determinant protein (PEP-CTERM system associated) [Donghicola tyrosinivorans]|uniref:Polysaccharide chain length determinant protein (PEP-CTERM system associated) n=2 Tax=Donghicola tyrosinivorans TaxID=1652492 RepID=A0A2T0WRI2_9RHOB|nr:polysaccharide chain length determinant protein (PEP-CTERM system associated) [Donghicola tyrosinivorans]